MSVYEIWFQSHRWYRKGSGYAGKGLAEDIQSVDLTDSSVKFSDVALEKEDIAVIAVPSYGGRVPGTAAERLSAIRGNGARAILVCVYGNRAYEDTLVELQDIAKQAGFRVLSAVAAIGGASIARQFATGRPGRE